MFFKNHMWCNFLEIIILRYSFLNWHTNTNEAQEIGFFLFVVVFFFLQLSITPSVDL